MTIPGDINGDVKVNLSDLVFLAEAYGTNSTNAQTVGTGLAAHHWNPNADINGARVSSRLMEACSTKTNKVFP